MRSTVSTPSATSMPDSTRREADTSSRFLIWPDSITRLPSACS
jgi:hypothetical protein